MKRRAFPLSVKIVLIAVLNVAVLLAAGAAFVTYELGREFTSVLLAPGRDRIAAVAGQLAMDLSETPEAERDRLLERYGRDHGVRFLLFRNDGTRIAGTPADVPAEVTRRIVVGGPRLRGLDDRREPPGPRDGPPPGRGGPRPPFDPGRSGPPLLPATPPFLVTTDAPDKYWVGVRLPIRARGRDETLPGTLMLASPTLLGNPFYFQPMPWLAITAATLALTIACWLPFVRGVTRSIGVMTRATADIAEGRFDVDVRLARQDELGALADSIQSMAGRLARLVDGQQRFLGDAAHELRSPLGRIALALGLIERDAGAAARSHVEDLREDVEMMARLTDELLALARAGLATRPTRLEPVNVRESALKAAKLEAAGADVCVAIDPALRVRADAELLCRALSNLIRNAVRYAGTAGAIGVTATTDGAAVRISVTDEGPGLPEADLEAVFQPFYRPQPARDRQSGGVGLGLAIVRSAVDACGGSVSCGNRVPSGLTVTLRLPAA